MSEFTNRVLRPAAFPVVAAIIVGSFTFTFSRILLAVPEAGSTTLALLIAAQILGVASVLAATSRIKPAQRVMLALVGLAIIGGGAATAATLGIRTIEKEAEEVEIAAKDIQFDTASLTLPADQPVALVFHNEDAGVPHNVGIYADDTYSDELFVGEIFSGVNTKTYEIEPLEAGTYAFRCDVHPSMAGTVTVGEEGSGEAPAPTTSPTASSTESPSATPGEGPTSASIEAKGIAYLTDSIELRSGVPTTIEFHNADPGIPHNVAIFAQEGDAQPLFAGEIFNGDETKTYELPAIDAGTYVFMCQVHPNMKGTAVFR